MATLCSGTGSATDCTTLTGTPPSGGAAIPPCSNGAGAVNCAVTVLDHFTSSFHWARAELRGHLAPAAMVSGHQQRADGCPDRRHQLHHQRRLFPRARPSRATGPCCAPACFVGNTQTGNGYSSTAGRSCNGTAQSLTCDNSTGSTPTVLACIEHRRGRELPPEQFRHGPAGRSTSTTAPPIRNPTSISTSPRRPAATACMRSPSACGSRPSAARVPAICPMRPSAGSSRTDSSIRPPSIPRTCSSAMSTSGITSSMPCSSRAPISRTPPGQADYCPQQAGVYSTAMFTGFTDIDRQTELSDDDGTLTGLTNNASRRPREPSRSIRRILQRAGADRGMPPNIGHHARRSPARSTTSRSRPPRRRPPTPALMNM